MFFLWIHSQRFFFEVCLVNDDRPCPRPLTFSEYIFLLDKNKVHGQYYPICIFFRPERKEKIFYTAKNKSRKGCSRHEEKNYFGQLLFLCWSCCCRASRQIKLMRSFYVVSIDWDRASCTFRPLLLAMAPARLSIGGPSRDWSSSEVTNALVECRRGKKKKLSKASHYKSMKHATLI